MAAKFHISPNTGRPNLCRAEKGACPIGGSHYGSKEAAQKAYEKEMASATLAAPMSKQASNYASPFKRTEQVRGATVWAYDDIVAAAGGKAALVEANPRVSFRKAKDGSLVVTGQARYVEAYIQEPGGSARDIAKSLGNLKPAPVRPQPVAEAPSPQPAELEKSPESDEAVFAPSEAGPSFDAEGEALPDADPFEDFETMGGWGAVALDEADVDFSKLEEPALDDDWSDIKCDDCGRPISSCSCGECEFCGAMEGDEHYEDCVHYRAKPKAYSWE